VSSEYFVFRIRTLGFWFITYGFFMQVFESAQNIRLYLEVGLVMMNAYRS
jgi:hypothetical protein